MFWIKVGIQLFGIAYCFLNFANWTNRLLCLSDSDDGVNVISAVAFSPKFIRVCSF